MPKNRTVESNPTRKGKDMTYALRDGGSVFLKRDLAEDERTYEAYLREGATDVHIGTIESGGGYGERSPRGSRIATKRWMRQEWHCRGVGGYTRYGRTYDNLLSESVLDLVEAYDRHMERQADV